MSYMYIIVDGIFNNKIDIVINVSMKHCNNNFKKNIVIYNS